MIDRIRIFVVNNKVLCSILTIDLKADLCNVHVHVNSYILVNKWSNGEQQGHGQPNALHNALNDTTRIPS